MIVCCVSCTQHELKKIVSKFENGSPNLVVYYYNKDDTLTFKKEVFYESGKQEYIGNIIEGKKEGIWNWWYENGNKKDQCKYKNGVEIDTIFHWYESGNIKQVGVLLDGKPNSEKLCTVCCNINITRYYETGELKESFTTIDDKFEGKYYKYYENGTWILRTYVKGILNGETIEHIIDSNGTTNILGQYKYGSEEGLWKWYDIDSTLIQTIVYKSGKEVSKN